MLKMKPIFLFIIIIFSLACTHAERPKISFDGIKNFDLDVFQNRSAKEDKHLLIYFTGLACVNCRYFEDEISSDQEICEIINENYIFIPLNVDDRTKADKKNWKKSQFSDKILMENGSLNSELQIQLTKSGSQPYMAVIDNKGNITAQIHSRSTSDEILAFLKE